MYSFLSYKYKIKKFAFFVKRELLKENINNKNNQLINTKLFYNNYSFGTSFLFNTEKVKLFFKKKGKISVFNYEINPFYINDIFDIDFNINYKEEFYIEKKSNYDWIENNQNNYYELGYYNKNINLYARYIEKQINSTISLQEELIYGLNYNFKLDIFSNLSFIFAADLFSGNYFNDVFENIIYFKRYFFKNDLKLTCFIKYNYLTESIGLIGSDYYNGYISADIKGGRLFFKIKNLFKDKIHYYGVDEKSRTIVFGFNLFLYN